MKEILISSVEQFQDVAQYLPDNIVVSFEVTAEGVIIRLNKDDFYQAKCEYEADRMSFE